MLKRAKHAKPIGNSERRLAHGEYVNIHNNAIVHAIIVIEPIDNDSLPSPLMEEVLMSSAPTVLSSCISCILHPFSCRLTCTVYLPTLQFFWAGPINSLPCILTYT